MHKKTLVIISLVISIVSLIYMFLVYYGVIRYYLLHHRSTEHYFNKYGKIPPSKDRVVVSFTATPEQLKNLKPFINSILDQTVRVNDIALTVPYKDINKVPDEFKHLLSIYGIKNNYNHANDIIPVILREPDSNTKIIVVNPTMVYGNDFIADMIDESKTGQDTIIYGRIGTNKYGILIKPAFFTDKITECKNTDQNCTWINKFAPVKEVGCPKTYPVRI